MLLATNQLPLMIGLIFIGTFGRYLFVSSDVPPNFEIIMVTTFLAAIFLKPAIAVFVPLISMIFSDLLLGNPIFVGNQMNRIVLFTYSGFAMISLITVFNQDRFRRGLGEVKLRNLGIAMGVGIGFVLIYDVWTNIGWWYLLYPHTANSLVLVFTAGIPFMINHILSGIITFTVIALPIVSYSARKHKIVIPTRLRKAHRLIVAAVAICLIILSLTGTAMQIPRKGEIWFEKTDETSVKIVVLGDGCTIEDNIFAYDGDTVFSILKKCSARNDFSLNYTYYEQFDSIMIDSINGDINGDNGRYWQYYVNGELPMIGCDKYMVSNGDHIEWSFETIPLL